MRFRILQFYKQTQEYLEALKLDRALKNLDQERLDKALVQTVSHLKQVKEQEKLPVYIKRHKFVSVGVLHNSKAGVPIFVRALEVGLATASLILVVSLAASKPGENLHPYRTAAKQFRVALSPSAQDRATAAVSLARENFTAAEKIVKRENSTPEEKRAAVIEITKKTKSVLQRVAKAAKNPAEKTEDRKEQEQLALRLTVLTADQLELAKSISATENENTEEDTSLVAAAESNAAEALKIEEGLMAASEQKDQDKVTDVDDGQVKSENTETTKDQPSSPESASNTENNDDESTTSTKISPTENSGKVIEEKNDTIQGILPPKVPSFQGGFIPEPPSSTQDSF